MSEPLPVPTAGNPTTEIDDDKNIELMTPEEISAYLPLLEGEYNEINPHDRKKVRNKDVFYRVVHVYPRFIGIMEDQFIAKVVVERYKKIKGPNGEMLRVPFAPIGEKSAEFHMDAKAFPDKYRDAEK